MKLDRSEATLVDSVRMVVSLSGTRSSDSEPVVHGLEDFTVSQGGRSSRVEIINGKVNAGIDYAYFIQPRKTGTFNIGPAEVTVEGKTFRSNPATLTVVKAPQLSGVDRGPLFLTASVSSHKAYLEEQVIYTLKLYRLAKVKDISLHLPETEHLAFKQLGKPVEYQSVYDGRAYQVLEVRYALVPSREGEYMIGPARMDMTVFQPGRRSSRNLFDDPFFSFSRGRSMTLTSEPLALNVLPLPEEGRLAGFSGLVGTFQIESSLEPSEIRAGESATLTVLLKGRGNINRIPDLKVPSLTHTKVYADQPILRSEPDAEGLAGSKTMKWALVPDKEGRYQIPRLSVSFFDTTTDQYRVIKTPALTLSVLPGEARQVQAFADSAKGKRPEGPARQAVKELGRDILPVHTFVKDLTPGFRVWPWSAFFWLVLIGPLFVYVATFLGLRFRRNSDRSVAAVKAKKAARRLTRRCRQEGLSSNDLVLAVRDYLNERFGLTPGSLTPDEAAQILKSKGVRLDTAQKLQAILQGLEDAVYTGKGNESCDIGEDIPGLINRIEKEVR
ncbi:MAG: protein BatD [Proteobacteria bacterium]|nr:protein BatD [Pseudomonadota bacterium]